MTDRIWNGTVVREKRSLWHIENKREPRKGVVISQTKYPDRVIVRYEGNDEWEESIRTLEVLEESPLVDGTRAYS
jgi:hypothetical protein